MEDNFKNLGGKILWNRKALYVSLFSVTHYAYSMEFVLKIYFKSYKKDKKKRIDKTNKKTKIHNRIKIEINNEICGSSK